jgi:hypothetical protein
MRMGELYLILAEALAEQGNPEALDWVNAVRARGTVDMPPKEVGIWVWTWLNLYGMNAELNLQWKVKDFMT